MKNSNIIFENQHCIVTLNTKYYVVVAKTNKYQDCAFFTENDLLKYLDLANDPNHPEFHI